MPTMKPMTSYIAVGVVSLAVCCMFLYSAEAYKCYSCTTSLGINSGNCIPVNNQTSILECGDGCQTITTIGSSVSRGCGSAGNSNGTSCTGISSFKVCTFTCRSDYCNSNGGVVNSLKSNSITAILSAVALAVYVTASGRKMVA